MATPLSLVLAMVAGCFRVPPSAGGDSPPAGQDDTAPVDSVDTTDSGETAGDTGGGAETADTAPTLPSLEPGETGEVYISSDVGRIAVRVHVPAAARYPEGAGVVVDVPEFLNTPELVGFYSDIDATQIGLVQLEFLWPGWADDCCESEGVFDYGGPTDIAALRDVLRFALGDLPTVDGQRIQDLVQLPVLLDDVGLWASSHPGMAAVNVLALHGDELGGVAWYIGRENPTVGPLASMEIGYYDADGEPVLNPGWSYPDGYGPEELAIDYSRARWDPACCDDGGPHGRVWFDVDGDEQHGPDEFTLGDQVPRMYDKRYFSCQLLEALAESGSIEEDEWPDDLATPEEAEEAWGFRESTSWFPELSPELKVMLLFGVHDHVQPAPDKPHVHQAWDGFHGGADAWVRLNPDAAYLEWLGVGLEMAYEETDANTTLPEWAEAERWAVPTSPGEAVSAMPWVALAEMSDRAYTQTWDDDLDGVLFASDPPEVETLP